MVFVVWKYLYMVYCFDSYCNTQVKDTCFRITQGRVIDIQCSIFISQYKNYMVSVNLAYMKQLHCNATVMGPNRWWLKLLFYFLNVETENYLLL